MKKVITVVLLISTLYLSHVVVPEIAFGQDTLAEQVFKKYKPLLMRDDIRAMVPLVFEALILPDVQKLLTPVTIAVVVSNPKSLKTFIPDIDENFIRLMEEDAKVKKLMMDPLVQRLIQNPLALKELGGIIKAGKLLEKSATSVITPAPDSAIPAKKPSESHSPDINGDETVNILDLVFVTNHFMKTVTNANRLADVNMDGVINILDLVLIAQNFD